MKKLLVIYYNRINKNSNRWKSYRSSQKGFKIGQMSLIFRREIAANIYNKKMKKTANKFLKILNSY